MITQHILLQQEYISRPTPKPTGENADIINQTTFGAYSQYQLVNVSHNTISSSQTLNIKESFFFFQRISSEWSTVTDVEQL